MTEQNEVQQACHEGAEQRVKRVIAECRTYAKAWETLADEIEAVPFALIWNGLFAEYLSAIEDVLAPHIDGWGHIQAGGEGASTFIDNPTIFLEDMLLEEQVALKKEQIRLERIEGQLSNE